MVSDNILKNEFTFFLAGTIAGAAGLYSRAFAGRIFTIFHALLHPDRTRIGRAFEHGDGYALSTPLLSVFIFSAILWHGPTGPFSGYLQLIVMGGIVSVVAAFILASFVFSLLPSLVAAYGHFIIEAILSSQRNHQSELMPIELRDFEFSPIRFILYAVAWVVTCGLLGVGIFTIFFN